MWAAGTSRSGSSRSRWPAPRSASCARRTSCTPRSTSSSCSPGAPRSTSCSPPSSSRGCRCSSTSAPSSSCSCSASCSRARRCARSGQARQRPAARRPRSSSLFLFGVLDRAPRRRVRRRGDQARRQARGASGSTANVGDEHLPRLRGAVRGRVDAAPRRARRRRRHRAEGLTGAAQPVPHPRARSCSAPASTACSRAATPCSCS